MKSYLVFLAVFLFTGCTPWIEINIVQRSSVQDDGQGTSTSSVDTNFDEEETTMELIVPIK